MQNFKSTYIAKYYEINYKSNIYVIYMCVYIYIYIYIYITLSKFKTPTYPTD